MRRPQLLAQHTILGFEVLDDLRLLALKPAAHDQNQRLQKMPSSSDHGTILNRLASPSAGCFSRVEGAGRVSEHYAWREAFDATGIEDFRSHELRDAWAAGMCRMDRRSTGPARTERSSLKMAQCYVHLSGEPLLVWLERPALQLVADNFHQVPPAKGCVIVSAHINRKAVQTDLSEVPK